MDYILIIAAFLLGGSAATLAYRVGGRSWVHKFAIKGEVDDKGRRLRPVTTTPRPGLLGELAALGMVLILLAGVNLVTEDTGVLSLVLADPQVSIAMLCIIFAIVVIYEVYICRKAKTDGHGPLFCKRLIRGYVPYTLYSAINFAAMILIVALIAMQTFMQFQGYQVTNQELDTMVAQLAQGGPDQKMLLTEQIYGVVRMGASQMIDQINTLLLLIFCSLGTQFLVKHTPIGQIYEKDAMRTFDLLVWLSIGFIAIFAWSLHFFVYDGFFGKALSALDASRAAIAQGGWEMMQRFNDLYLDLTERRGLTGFLLSLTNDRGGLLLVLGAVQWMNERRIRKAEEAKAAQG